MTDPPPSLPSTMINDGVEAIRQAQYSKSFDEGLAKGSGEGFSKGFEAGLKTAVEAVLQVCENDTHCRSIALSVLQEALGKEQMPDIGKVIISADSSNTSSSNDHEEEAGTHFTTVSSNQHTVVNHAAIAGHSYKQDAVLSNVPN
ncbi:unnamed protein product [Cylindrotheca closterium]|uniref:Essential protein Yae1 N-terminal domain-containing protein n=1 Tax=Cylindrotheca closterium TaxID=2856 RepID=A0AAD2JIG8_9STRA|nr:unnamed protein product [Cylindrotheca closterium]CAJ1953958.1 unnamed protein product [Cylindrotheca closterium]